MEQNDSHGDDLQSFVIDICGDRALLLFMDGMGSWRNEFIMILRIWVSGQCVSTQGAYGRHSIAVSLT